MKKWIGIAALASVMGASSALAGIVTEPDPVGGLVMTIDTANEEFYFTGSDTGNANMEPQPCLEFRNESYSLDVPLASDVSSCFDESFDCGFGINAARAYFYVLHWNDITSLTAKGASAAVSYAGISDNQKSVFESMIGDSLSLTDGSGYSSIAVQAIPEPATGALLGMSAVGLWAFRRAKKHYRI